MIAKFQKYLHYFLKFVKSPRKKAIIVDLKNEVKEKGLLEGIRSLLHKKSGKYFPDEEFQPFLDGEYLNKEYSLVTKISFQKQRQPKVSIVIPVYNQIAFTNNCICSIFENTKNVAYEIIIADDNSPENVGALMANFENIVYIKNTANLGFLKNCNNAASHAKGEYILFLNNDTQVMPHWLDELLFVFDNFENVGIAGSMLLYPDGSLQEAGGIVFADGHGMNYGNCSDPRKPQFNYIKECDYISGASIMIKKSLWNEIGGFDERYTPAYFEDSDLCFEVRKRGSKVYYQPYSKVVHFEGISHGKNTKSGIKKFQVINRNKFVTKWHNELKMKPTKDKKIFLQRDRTHNKKHVLIVDHNVPTVDKDAGSRTINNFVDSFLALDYKVSFMVPNMYPLKNYVDILQRKGVEVLHGDDFVFWGHVWERYFKINLRYFEAVLLSRSSICVPILKFIKQIGFRGTIVYYGHDLGYIRLEQEANKTGDESLMKQYLKLKSEEDFMYDTVDKSLAVSHDEIAYLKTYIKKPVFYIPPYFFEPPKNIPAYNKREGILFVGGFQHPPNHDAMKWFLDEVYESVHREGISFTIAGSFIPEFVLEYKNKFNLLKIRQEVSTEELNDIYSKNRIAIVPLRIGAGVKGKVIEAMSKGVPVVGTNQAFEGLFKDDKFLYHGCNTKDELTGKLLEVYNSAQVWNELSEFGLNYVEQYFDKNVMKQVINDVFKS